jgi:hypothetical protein
MMESLACGCPVVVKRTEGLVDYIRLGAATPTQMRVDMDSKISSKIRGRS